MLTELQQQLQERFTELAALRSELKYPIYAIEHGLDELSLQNATADARTRLRVAGPSPEHWLVWVSLAAEAGYRFSGEEFWGPFEPERGQWLAIDRRRALRSFYERFAAQYGGPKPVGRWAAHFNIISWPIANAVLPLYLQRAFAKHLYELRYELAHRAAVGGAGVGVGQFLLDQYRGGPSQRFHDFLQQTDLTTQIVFALRDEHLEGAVPRIDANVLSRIVGDLERHSLERSYLRDTRQALHAEGVRVAANLRTHSAGPSRTGERGSQVPTRTHLVARRQNDGGFVVGFRLPNVRAILEAAGMQAAALAKARVRIAGRTNRPEPASALVELGLKEWRLDAFPAPRTPLFTIDQASNDARALLDPASRIDEPRVWLLKRRADGLYQQAIQQKIRVGQDYLLLSRTKLSDATVQSAGLAPVTCAPPEASAYRLTTPSLVSAAQLVALGSLGIGSTTGISIDAVGLNPGACNDPDGLPSWTSMESVLLRFRADVKDTAFQASLDGSPAETFRSDTGTAFVELGRLDPGRHEMAVSLAGRDGRPTATETFAFEILSPRAWPLAMRDRAGFKLQVHPPGASLLQLMAAEAGLYITGPAGRQVRWSLELYDASGQFSAALRVGDTRVGDQPEALQPMLEASFREQSGKIDDAPRIDVVASLDELGRQAQSFAHPVNPLRWKFDAAKGVAHLIDETDHAQPVVARSYAYRTPTKRKTLSLAEISAGVTVDSPGLLLEAMSGDERALLFASPRRSIVLHDLSALSENQGLAPAATASATMIRLLDSLRRWRRAVATGQLAPLRKQTTVRWLEQQIEIIACGEDFSAQLRAVVPKALERAQKIVGGSPGFGYRMRTFTGRTATEASRQLAASGKTYGIDGAEEWASAVATLAFAPTTLRLPASADKSKWFEALLANKALLRGAFLARTVSRTLVHERIRATA